MIRSSSRSLFAAVLLLAVSAAASDLAPPTAAELRAEVERLTAPAMEGRATGTPGGDLATRTLADELRAAGLHPLGDEGTFLQSFTVRAGKRLGPDNQLEALGATPRPLAPSRDWTPHGGAPDCDLTARVAFVGHGIGDGARDDYGTLDVRGRLVLAFGGDAGLRGGTRLEKLLAARRHGAAGLLLVDDRLPALAASAAHVELPSATLTFAAAETLLTRLGGSERPPDPPTLGAPRHSRGAPRLAELTAPVLLDGEVRLRIRLEREERRGANVVGLLPGTDPALEAEAIVIGAHWDHLGRSASGVLHPGADDNASGTALVVGLARAFARSGGAPRSLVFALFGGEELGLLGSARYTKQPAWPLGRTIAMINLDMVGRLRDDTLRASGVDSGDRLRAVAADAARAEGMTLKVSGGPFEGSDHLPFYRAGVPVVLFTTGGHEDYHGPSDTADKISAAGMARICAVVVRAATALAAGPRPAFVKIAPPARRQTAGALFGIVADPGASVDGVTIATVVPDTAAARAGIAQGDVIYRFEGVPVDTFEVLRRLIRTRRPGDRVRFDYVRDGEPRHGSEVLGGTPEGASDG
ncbi:MAG: M28 family peptidase [Candidatus Rokubacteria bacterium]|nr:M28 family peptidase [Candidatus Rokubacteria bacterium]